MITSKDCRSAVLALTGSIPEEDLTPELRRIRLETLLLEAEAMVEKEDITGARAEKRKDCHNPWCGLDGGGLCRNCDGMGAENLKRLLDGIQARTNRPATFVRIESITAEDAESNRVNITASITVRRPKEFMEALLRSVPVVKTAEEGAARVWGIPVEESPYMPNGRGLLRSACDCRAGVVQLDGGLLLHVAKRHCVIIEFGDNGANKD